MKKKLAHQTSYVITVYNLLLFAFLKNWLFFALVVSIPFLMQVKNSKFLHFQTLLSNFMLMSPSLCLPVRLFVRWWVLML